MDRRTCLVSRGGDGGGTGELTLAGGDESDAGARLPAAQTYDCTQRRGVQVRGEAKVADVG
jgi:hypothetical protein